MALIIMKFRVSQMLSSQAGCIEEAARRTHKKRAALSIV